MASVIDQKPHAVCFPAPSQGHITPMLKLEKLLHQRGFNITFVNTEFNHKRLLKSRGSDALNGLPSFQFEAIPDGLPPSDPDATQDLPSLGKSVSTYRIGPFKELIAKLNDTASSRVPPVSCVVSDAVMTFTLEAAEEFGIPEVLLWTSSACSYLGFVHFSDLIDRGLTPQKDESCFTNGYLEQTMDWIPGMKGIRLRDLPTFIRTTDPDDDMLKFFVQQTTGAKNASAIVLNTYETFEQETINALSSIFLPPIYSIGPLHLFDVRDDNLDGIGSNLWKEELECLDWLDTKNPNSVVYVNFGSITVITHDQLVEFAWGLANSKQTFLWIIRPDLVPRDSDILPSDFFAEIKNRGKLASWCLKNRF